MDHNSDLCSLDTLVISIPRRDRHNIVRQALHYKTCIIIIIIIIKYRGFR